MNFLKNLFGGKPPPPKGPEADFKAAVAVLEAYQDYSRKSHPTLGHIDPLSEIQGEIEFSKSPELFQKFAEHMRAINPDREVPDAEVQAVFDSIYKQAKPFSRFEAPTTHTLLESLRGKLDKACSARNIVLKKTPVFGTLRTGCVNGMAANIRNDSHYLILLDDGILGFANLFAKCVAQYFPFRGVEDESLSFSTDREEILREITSNSELQVRFFDVVQAYAVHGFPHAARQYFLQSRAMHLAGMIRDMMETFIMAHEYGHCIAGHLESGKAMSLNMNADAVAQASAGDLKTIVPESWEKEFEADLIGLVLTLEVMRQGNLSPTLGYLGVDLVFACIDLLEQSLGVLEHGEIVEHRLDTHPPARQRRERLSQAMQQLTHEQIAGPALELVATASVGTEFMTERVMSALRRMHADGIRPNARWRRSIV